MAIFLVLCKCDKDIFERIEDRTREMLSNSQKKSIRFEVLSEDSDAHRAVERIRGGLQPGDADPRVVHVIYVFDGDEDEAKKLNDGMHNLQKTLELDGTMERYFHLIWLIHEAPYPKYEYEKISSLFGIGYKERELFNYVYILSDKRSDLIYDSSRSGYINGPALLINRLLLRGRVERGVYTVGTGQKTVSEHEIRKYVGTKLAAAIEKSGLAHPNRIEDLCGKAFGFDSDSVALGIYECLTRKMINGDFCVIEGEALTIPDIPSSLPTDKFELLFENWRNSLLTLLQRTPFIWDAERFFEENGGIKTYFDKITTEVKTKISMQDAKAKAPRFSPKKKEIVRLYNEFVDNRNKAQVKLLDAFMLHWRTEANTLLEPIRELAREWKEFLDHYKENDKFINNCISQAETKIREIDKAIASLTYEEVISESKNMKLKESWDWLMERLIDYVMNDRDVRAIDLMSGVGRLTADELDNRILSPIQKSAEVKMACVAHGEQDVFGIPVSTFFVPEHLFRGQIEYQLPNYSFTDVANEYQNIEEISLYPIDLTKFALLTFITQKPQCDIASKSMNKLDVEKRDAYPPVTTPVDSLKASINENVLDMSVSMSDYKLTFDWSSTNAVSLRCKIISPGEPDRTVTIYRQNYEMQGSWDISDQIKKGLHTIELWSKEKCESRIRIPGKAETIRISIEDGNSFQAGNVEFLHQTLTVISVDEDEENMLDNRVAGNLYFSNNGNSIKMPRPLVARRKQSWEVYRLTDEIPEISAGKDFEGMYQIEVESM